MKILKYITIFGLCLTFSSFFNNESRTSEFLFQKWVYEKNENGKVFFENKKKLNKHRQGIKYKKNGTIIRIQNTSWCGDQYEKVFGTWKKLSDSLIEIEYDNWSGSNKSIFKILELTKSKLIIKPISRKN